MVVLDQGSSELRQVPFGTCIWTTGIRMHPLSEQLAQQLQGEQEHWCARHAPHAQCMPHGQVRQPACSRHSVQSD